MRRLLLTLAAGAAAASLAPAADASLYCRDLGPVPGYGPVCLLQCQLGMDPQVNPKNLGETLQSFIVMCPA